MQTGVLYFLPADPQFGLQFGRIEGDNGVISIFDPSQPHDLDLTKTHTGTQVEYEYRKIPTMDLFIATMVVERRRAAHRKTGANLTKKAFVMNQRSNPPIEKPDSAWTPEKNHRRCELVDKEIEGTISPDEKSELETLQAEMLAYRRKVAPLPLKDLRELHQELLQKVSELPE